MFYFVHDKQKANIPLEEVVVVLSRKHKRRFEIDTGNVVLHLQTKTDEERGRWTAAFDLTQKMLKRAAAQQAAQEADVATNARRQQVAKAKSDGLTQTLALAKSIQQVLISHIEVLRTEARNPSLTPSSEASSGSSDLAASADSDHDKKKKSGHRRARSTQVHDPAAEFGSAGAASNSTAAFFVNQADEFRKIAARFVDTADALARDIQDANDALERELEKEREVSSKLKERVKDLRSKNGSLRKELKHFSDSASRSPDLDGPDAADDPNMFADVVTATDASSDSDSDEYFDPLEFSTVDDSDDDGDKFVSDSDSESDSDSQFFDADHQTGGSHGSKAKAESSAAPPTSPSAHKLRMKTETEIQRRTSLVTLNIPARKSSSLLSVDEAGEKKPASPVGKPKSSGSGTSKSPVAVRPISQQALMRRPSVPLTVVQSFGQQEFLDTLNTVPAGFKHRDSLPVDKNFKVKVSLVKILKDSIGKDLSRITIPVQFAEPTNLLQRLVEDMQYVNVLDAAAKCKDSLLRLAHVAGFAAGGYSGTIGRLGKPFNPLLGETYEWVNREQGFRLVSEQVSHHPQISALHAEGKEWAIWTTILTKNKYVHTFFDLRFADFRCLQVLGQVT